MATGSALDYRDVPDRPNPYSLYPWLGVAAGTVSDTASGKLHPAWLAAFGLALFAIGYMAAIWLRWRTRHLTIALVVLGALTALTLGLNLGFGSDMGSLAQALSIAFGAVIPWRERQEPPLAIVAVFLLGCAAAAVAWGQGQTPGTIWQTWYGTILPGLIVAVMYRFIEAIRELRRTRDELAHAAVDAERLRFARDVHDLLGQTLSVMVVKAQVVRKLAARDPDAVVRQATDIEQAGRQALTEVRKAVTGYRGRGLSREIETARTALADAGITADVRQDGPPLPEDADAVLGWVIREGVTNVIKHSGGRRCQIEVRHGDETASVEITDDGTGEAVTTLPSGQHGLSGLTERVAAAGGTLEAGPRIGGGFRLSAALPAAALPAAGTPAKPEESC
jgi:two-component system, NarL family, sensor histidine kinase DesK